MLYPAEPRRLGKGNTWMLRRFEEQLAIVTRHPLAIEAAHPVPLAAALLSFVLLRYGIPEESAPRLPTFHWD